MRRSIERIQRAAEYHENLAKICCDGRDREFSAKYAQQLRKNAEELTAMAEADELQRRQMVEAR